MKIAILGYDVEGRVSFDYFGAQGHELTICDQNSQITVPDGVPSVLGEGYLDNLDRFDLLVRTAGLPPQLILDKNPSVADKITTQVNEFFKVCPSKNIIGVTGTKGKGTTSTLITKMLEAAGQRVHLGGNIGIAPLELLNNDIQADDWVVLELSSFQLIDIQYSPPIAVCLMIVPEHLNWHPDINEYTEAKSQLFARQTPEDIAIYFADNETSRLVAANGQGRKIPYFAPPGAVIENDSVTIDGQTICKTTELKLLGKHNWQNICAAVTAVWQITQKIEALRSALTTFTGIEHRLQLIRELDGVKYYDDSYGTTPETAIVAIQAFDAPKVVILGGSDKGASYDELAKTVTASNVRSVVLIGEQASKIQASLEKAGFSNFVAGGETMEQIVATCRGQAQSGDIVLLSTACASLDMFKNYKDRAEKFSQAVQALA